MIKSLPPRMADKVSLGGDRWQAFGGFDEGLLDRCIRPRLPHWQLDEPAKPPADPTNPDLALLYEDEFEPGAASLIRLIPEGPSETVTIYPFSRLGSIHNLVVEGVVVDETGLEAVITGAVEMPDGQLVAMSFFDTHHHLNCKRYDFGGQQSLPFHLIAFATMARRPHQNVITMPRPKWMEHVSNPPPEGEMVELNVSQMCAWLPGVSCVADIVEFRGEVVSLRHLDTFFDAHAGIIELS